ncbi:MAG: TetR family transcriptional regulator [Gammaproteobacteria bacterium]
MAGLREKKYARTRLSLVRQLAQAVEKMPWQDVSIRELCEQAELSEATFFNYFPQKQDLLQLVIQLWLLEISGQLKSAGAESGLKRIHAQFALCAQTCRDRPGFMHAVIHWVAGGGKLNDQFAPSMIERQLTFPDDENLKDAPVVGLDRLLADQLDVAVSTGQLPVNTVIPVVLTGLLSLLFGLPLILLGSDPGRISVLYQQQLQIYLAGLQTVSQSAA